MKYTAHHDHDDTQFHFLQLPPTLTADTINSSPGRAGGGGTRLVVAPRHLSSTMHCSRIAEQPPSSTSRSSRVHLAEEDHDVEKTRHRRCGSLDSVTTMDPETTRSRSSEEDDNTDHSEVIGGGVTADDNCSSFGGDVVDAEVLVEEEEVAVDGVIVVAEVEDTATDGADHSGIILVQPPSSSARRKDGAGTLPHAATVSAPSCVAIARATQGQVDGGVVQGGNGVAQCAGELESSDRDGEGGTAPALQLTTNSDMNQAPAAAFPPWRQNQLTRASTWHEKGFASAQNRHHDHHPNHQNYRYGGGYRAGSSSGPDSPEQYDSGTSSTLGFHKSASWWHKNSFSCSSTSWAPPWRYNSYRDGHYQHRGSYWGGEGGAAAGGGQDSSCRGSPPPWLKEKAPLASRSWANLKQLSRRHLFDSQNYHKYSYFAILDFEATCEWDHSIEPEVIEFPTVILDAETLEVVDEFRKYVKPKNNPKLRSFCTHLTGIQQQTVDGGETFEEVYAAWLHGFMAKYENALLITCGDWDLETMLPSQLVQSGMREEFGRIQQAMFDYREDAKKRLNLTTFCNIKIIFANLLGDPRKHKNYAFYRRKKQDGMVIMLEALGLRLDGRHHSGLDDARNIAKIVRHLLENYGEHVIIPTTLCGERQLERIYF